MKEKYQKYVENEFYIDRYKAVQVLLGFSNEYTQSMESITLSS